MLTGRIVLTAVLLVTLVVCGLWDVGAILMDKPEATISRVLREASYSNPILPFLFGLLAGHIFG